MYIVTWRRFLNDREESSAGYDEHERHFSELNKAEEFLKRRYKIIKKKNWFGGYVYIMKHHPDGDYKEVLYEIDMDGKELFYDDVKSQV